jgi:hypothetical protein
VAALDELREYAARRAQLSATIRRARREGATWEQIAAAANMSRAGVIRAAAERRTE